MRQSVNIKLEKYLHQMENKSGISKLQKKNLQDMIKKFEVELLMLMDEAVFQASKLSDEFSDKEDDRILLNADESASNTVMPNLMKG